MTPTVFVLVVWLVTVSRHMMVMMFQTPIAEAIPPAAWSADLTAARSESITPTANILDGPGLARALPPDLVDTRL